MANDRAELVDNIRYLSQNWHKIPTRFKQYRTRWGRRSGVFLSSTISLDYNNVIISNSSNGKREQTIPVEQFSYKKVDNKTAHLINKTSIFNYKLLIMQADGEKVSAEDIAEVTNLDIRNFLVEQFGLEKFFKEMRAKVVHKSPKNRLLKLRLRDEEISMVEVKDPSTGKIYLLRVPPDLHNADEAVAWTFGLTMREYRPLMET